MRFFASIVSIVLVAGAGSAVAAASYGGIDYQGRVTVAGQAFTGSAQFKFALVDGAGNRLWTSGGHEASIEAGVPSGSVPLSVTGGDYRVRLGDPAAEMAPLPDEVAANWNALRIQTWFNDGEHGWAEAGSTALSKPGGSDSRSVQGATPDEDILQTILLELRSLRSEVGSLRKQLLAGDSGKAVGEPAPGLAKPKPKSAPVRVSLPEVQRHSLGSADAPVVLVEFTDFECGYCKRFFELTLPQLKRKYIDTGKLRFVSRNFPIKSHPQAEPAAQALLSAATQDPNQYWTMRAWLFANNRELSDASYLKYVEGAGLDVPQFLADYAAKRHGPELAEDVAAARSVGITGTPSFVLGTSDGKEIQGERIVGAKSFQIFEREIEALLAAQASGARAGAETAGDPDNPR